MRGSGRLRLIARGAVLAILIMMAALPCFAASAASASSPTHGAGLVIRHGNGKIVYVYVPFSGAQISGAELLARSGLPIEVSPAAGLGEEVCEIQQEGCPPSNCWCKSYASPAYYWHYYRLDSSGNWVYQQQGPTTTVVRDGDVDGWSWTAGQPDLPKTSIDEIAELNSVARPTSSATPALRAASVEATPAPSVSEQSAATRAATPIAHAVENNGGTSFTTVKTKSKATSNSVNGLTIAELVIALVILAVAGGWIMLLRRRDTS